MTVTKYVQQSGNVTPLHIAKWRTDGVLIDGGALPVPVPTVSISNGVLFNTRSEAVLATIASTALWVQTEGYSAIGDGGDALYKKVGGTTPGGFQSADGAWWALVLQSGGFFNVKNFGAKGDGATDDAAAINAALAYAGTLVSGIATSAYVAMPPGAYVISSTITIPNRVVLGYLKGGGRSVQINASNSFPINTEMVNLGGGSLCFGSRVEGLALNANNIAGSICLLSADCQEGSGYIDCVFSAYRDAGFRISGGSGQNIIGFRGEFFPSTSGSNFGIDVETAALVNLHSNSFVGQGGTNTAAVQWNCDGTCLGVHVEDHVTGVWVNGGTGLIAGVNGPSVAANVTYLVLGGSSTRYFTAVGLVKNAATYVLALTLSGLLRTDAFLPFYCAEPALSAGYDQEPSPFPYAATVNFNAANYSYWAMSNPITGPMTVAAPSGALKGRSLTVELLQDGSGGHVVTWNAVFKGVTLGASGTASQKAIISFMCDGTNWYQTGTSGWQT